MKKKHDREPTPRELQVLKLIHQHPDRVVLVPVIINGEERYSLGFLRQNSDGSVYCDVLASVLTPNDTVLDSAGMPGHQSAPSLKKDLN